MRIVVALGGNALLRRSEPPTAEVQRKNVRIAANSLASVAREHQLVITHGNGPQVGLLALQAAAYGDVRPPPLDVLGAESEGMIGYMIEQELGNLLPFERPFATILTMVEAVIDKDRASALLAEEVEADCLILATEADSVYLDWGTPEQRPIRTITPDELRRHQFPAGSMGPKVDAACTFVERTGGRAAIGALGEIEEILSSRAGTVVER